MANLTRATRAIWYVVAFLCGELGVFFLGLALSALLEFTSTSLVWAVPACAVIGVVLVAFTCALIFVLNLND